jgi:hypothetical protein
MSKDKGSKNNKKAPADKSKGKSSSSYKEEDKGGKEKPAIDVFSKKPDAKKDKSSDKS